MKGINPDPEPFGETRYLGFAWDRESVLANAPEASGIYGLYHGIWIYVGEGDNIRTSLLTLLEEDDVCIARYQPSGFAFELVASRARHQRYLELLRDTEPICGREKTVLRTRRSGGSTGSGSEIDSKQVASAMDGSRAASLTTGLMSVKPAR